MGARPSARKLALLVGIAVVILIALWIGSAFLDAIPFAKARPPSDMTAVEEFLEWKGANLMATGAFETANATYAVYMAPAGRYLASGPSAYLFDTQGVFVDWTADMGDYSTLKSNFDLTSGHVTDFTKISP